MEVGRGGWERVEGAECFSVALLLAEAADEVVDLLLLLLGFEGWDGERRWQRTERRRRRGGS